MVSYWKARPQGLIRLILEFFLAKNCFGSIEVNYFFYKLNNLLERKCYG